MIRCASSASLSCTAIRTSLRPSTASGKIELGTSEETSDMTPCDSRRPRTIRASMSECVRKITTRSLGGTSVCELRELRADLGRRGDLVDLEQDHRHVVVLRRVADEGGDLAQHALAQLVGRQVRVRFDELAEPRFAEAVVARVHRLADPVGEEKVEIAGPQRNRLLA